MLQFDYLKHVTDGLDRDAVLNELMTAYGKDVWNFAYFITHSREMADDIAQDVFVKVYQQLYEFRGQSSIKTWLLAITRNTARDVLRSAWVRRVVLFDVFHSHTETSPSAERESMDKLMAEEIWAVVLKLPRKLREVLLMNSHYGLSMKEMADVLHVSIGTVKSRLHRARTAVNRRLTQESLWNGEEEWT
ncbi:sigma-70 family RNA polymerase sigma factor [Paenibacillus rhizovicinus]|uniref:RNA polymerase sigma factor n=1 Tax=Paenibacillus rhizovicinus TaxID=2704463 RepID=A0A6C0NXT7_9BACL|nr:sigma-70 family RNA polymerase sigma factor [Paenibacillus rhizovicinus]QHW31027.1 sigma-70 family RNA polymerase sigma factor [Paenibacillus rhizovicinus]